MMKDTDMLSSNIGPQSVFCSKNFFRANNNADMSTNDEMMQTPSTTIQLDESDEKVTNPVAVEDEENDAELEEHFEIYITDYTECCSEIEISETRLITRYADLIFTNFYRVYTDTIVLSGFTGCGVTTTAMYVAKCISENRCPERFKNAKVINISVKNFEALCDAESICNCLILALQTLKAKDFSKVIIFLDDFDEMPYTFLREYQDIIAGAKEMFDFEVLNFLIGIDSSFFKNDESNYGLSFIKDSVLINLEIEAEIIDIIKVLKPRIDELAVSHSNVKIGAKMLERLGVLVYSSLGGYINYTKFLGELDYVFAICERFGDKKVGFKHFREYRLRSFRYLESLPEYAKLDTAKHEAGHAVLGLALDYQISVWGVMIIGDITQYDGLTLINHRVKPEKFKALERDVIVDKIAFDLAGRVGQGIIELTASGDLMRAKEHAKEFVSLIGADLGECYVLDVEKDVVSESMAKLYEEKVQKLLIEGNEVAKRILKEEKQVHDEIVNLLMKNIIVTQTELKAIWRKYHK